MPVAEISALAVPEMAGQRETYRGTNPMKLHPEYVGAGVVLLVISEAGVESLRKPFRCHLWFPVTEGPVLDLDALPQEFAHRAALERFSRLRPGEHLLLRSRRELDGVWTLVSSSWPGEFGWVYLEEGPARWRADVTRRAPE